MPAALATTDRELHLVPALIAAASWRYVEFFTANIRNPNTWRAYARACSRFVAWCESRGLTLTTIRPHDVAARPRHLVTVQQPGIELQPFIHRGPLLPGHFALPAKRQLCN
jgi:hypothetical protein